MRIKFLENVKNKIQMNNANIILEPVSQLLLDVKLEDLFTTIKQVRDIGRIIIWATPKKLSQDFVVPFLEHLADLIVTLKSPDSMSILKKKRGDADIKVFIIFSHFFR